MSLRNFELKQGICLLNGSLVKGGWVAPPNERYAGKDYLTDESFKNVKESGINLLFGVIYPDTEFQDIVKFMDLCDKYDIYTIIPEECLGQEEFDLPSFFLRLEEYKKRKCVIGLNLRDEPGFDAFPIFKKNIALIKDRIGDLILYINHMPMYAKEEQFFGGEFSEMHSPISIKKYTEFMEQFYSEIGVNVLSYDFYPFLHEKGVCSPRYFKQLCLFNDLSRKYKKPAWNFTQVTSWSRDGIRNMTYSEIEWINNTAIATGIGGLIYFCYWTPESSRETFEHAMVTESGVKTRSYYFVRQANKRIDCIIPYIADSEFCGTIAFGDTVAEFPEEKNLLQFGNIEQIVADGTLIGCFSKNEKNKYLVVNTSLTEARVIELFFDKPVSAVVIDGAEKSDFEGQHLALIINEGQSVLVAEK